MEPVWYFVCCQNPSLTYMALTARACDYAVKKLKSGEIKEELRISGFSIKNMSILQPQKLPLSPEYYGCIC